MINGPMIEAQKGFAVLSNVDEGTFARFCKWAYCGFYSSAPVGKVLQSTTPEAEIVEVVQEPTPVEDSVSVGNVVEEDLWPPVPPLIVIPTKEERLKESFVERHYPNHHEDIAPEVPRANRDRSEDYTPVFLSHARIYVFAEMYEIQPLKALALSNLHAVLSIFTLWDECVLAVTELLGYVYANTIAKKSAEGEESEEMREMLKHYIGCEMHVLIRAEEFSELLKENGELLDDFLEMVGKRI
jgi:hypothetical protein